MKTPNPLHHFVDNEKFIKRLMLMPAVLVLIGIMIPFLIGVATSLTDKKLYAGNSNFIFLSNYINNFKDPVFLTSLGNTLAYVIMAILMQLPLAILAALLLDIPSRIRGFMRSVLVFPLLIPPIVSSLMWKTMMQPNSGVLNYLLSKFGIGPFPWLTSVDTALFSLVMIDTWVYLPFITIILLSGLQSLPQDILEAAQVDGASPVRTFFAIKLRWLKSSILLVLLFRVCDSLKAFELIYSTTRGGPLNASRTLNIMAYEEAFRWSSIGKAMSILFTLWILAYIASTFLMREWNKSGIE
ncbi:carbohydrate ABC transporter permease [Paenibacillus woosongensis]|uniref:ABC transporter permease subunit n=1 Tax=Paenibacillus woosongensis TaxID=307580 RepID=A0A7X2YYX5_9BACL|nr:sugar ABC transporter permease [Paenibacillus woosongensis]MUG44390.1 ABC transporter permease subunit [Paenibacillus woosongensis]